ncbi:phage replisome organizer N-terminal domain-containing protein [Exiguobacterium antarcticum]|uniref:phage replisome organizer N-terminal domain-containing protein n=1 Tax=Exiguobacterium antarcticum TaxID=132920 RepID=UPI00068F7C23|nr:phage replisome organizer N-terminal domain-containing protein [Exiguobacterium antarcticum]
MNEIKWIKLSVDMFDDEKIKLLEKMPDGDTLIVIWCKLLTMAGKGNHKGYIMLTESFPYTEDMLITLIDRPAATVRMAMELFQRFGMVEFDETSSAFMLPNWTKYQNIEGMEKQRELTRKRVARHREKQLEAPKPVDTPELPPSNVTGNADVTLRNGAREKKEERRKKKEEVKDIPVAQQVDQSLFESLWKLYPKKIDKKKAVAAYTKAIKKGTTHDVIATGLSNYLRYLDLQKSWLKPQDGGRWFEKERWMDEYDLTAPRQSNGSAPDHSEYDPTFGKELPF